MTVYIVLAGYMYEGNDIQLVTKDRALADQYIEDNKIDSSFENWHVEEHEVV